MNDIPPGVLQAEQRVKAPSPAPVAAPAPPPAVLEAEKRVAAPAPVPTTPPPTAPTEVESLGQRSLRRAGQEVLSAPGAIPGLYGLARAGIEAGLSDDVSLQDAMFTDEGRALIAAAKGGDAAAAAQLEQTLAADPTSMFRPGIRSMAEWYDWGGDVAGVTNNEDGSVPLDEEVGGLALSTLLTLPLSPAKLVQVPAKGALLGAKGAALTARTALQAAELMTPVTFGGPKTTAANLVVQTGINDATRALMDEPTLTGTVGLGTDDYTAGSVTPVTGLPEEEGADAETALVAGGALGTAAAVALGGGAALKRLGNRMARPPAVPGYAARPDEATIGDLPSRNAGEALKDASNALLDEDGILIESVSRTLGKAAAENYADTLRANTGQSVGAAVQRFFDGGMLGLDGVLRTIPMIVMKRQYKQLAKVRPGVDLRPVFNDTMLSLDEINNRARNINTMPGVETSVLWGKVQRGLAEPAVKKMVEDYDSVMRRFTEYRWKEGVINNGQFAKEMQRAFKMQTTPDGKQIGRGGYVPILDEPPKKSLVERAGSLFGGSMNPQRNTGILGFEQLRERGGNVRRRDPMDALERYAGEQIREIAAMRARRAFLTKVVNAPVQNFKQNVRLVERGQKGPGYTVRIRDNGEDQWFRVGDPRIATALQFRPSAVVPIMSDMRRLFQAGTTGIFDPLFAPVSLAYDALFGMLTARNDKIVTGVLDQSLALAAKRAGMDDRTALFMRQALSGVTRPIELTFTVLEGLFEGATGRIKMLYAERMLQRAAKNGTPVAMGKAKEAADIFLRSKYGMMHQAGYSGTHSLDDMVTGEQMLTERITQGINGTLTAQFYRHAMDTLREAYRVGIFSRNVAHAKLVNQGKVDYKRIARYTKEIGSDPSRRGSSNLLNATASTVPYANVIMHSLAHMVGSMNNPAVYSVLAATVVARNMMINNLSPEAREYYEKRTPDYKRISFLPLEQAREDGEAFDGAKHVEWLPIGPELGTLTAMASTLLDGMYEQHEADNMEPGLTQQLLTAAGDLFGFAVPPALNLASTAAGYGQWQPGAALDNRELFRQPFEDGGLQEFRGTGMNSGVVNDRAYNMVLSALGTTGRMIGDVAETMDSQMNRYGEDFFSALDEASDVFYFSAVERKTVGSLFSDNVTTPVGTTSSDRAYEIDKQMERVVNINRNVTPLLEGLEDADTPIGGIFANMPKSIRDNPQLLKEAGLVASYFGSAQHSKLLDEVSQLRKRMRRAQGDTNMSSDLRNTIVRDFNEQMQSRLENVTNNYGAFEDMMIENTGDPEWSLTAFVDRLEDHLLK